MMRGVKLDKGQRHPEAIIIYVPGDGQAHMVGLHKGVAGGYKYSAWTFLPEKELNGFLGELLESGFGVLDCRLLAQKTNPGMEKATPILVNRPDVSILEAAEMLKRFHNLLVKEAQSEAGRD